MTPIMATLTGLLIVVAIVVARVGWEVYLILRDELADARAARPAPERKEA